MTHLFVYGTLRGGAAGAHLLRGCDRITVGKVHGSLYDLGDYPALVLDDAGEVEGEVWRCEGAAVLRALDDYEGVGEGLFRRVRVEVEGLVCWTYVAGPLLESRLTPSRRVSSGRWG